MAARREKLAPTFRPFIVLSEKAFGGVLASVVVVAGTTASTLSLAEGEMIFRMPTTEKAVVNKVKKNPATITVAIFKS